jgi:hypothetical protein
MWGNLRFYPFTIKKIRQNRRFPHISQIYTKLENIDGTVCCKYISEIESKCGRRPPRSV